jgi:RimJ/RimL family protein N-acetyltransferase
LPTVQVVGFAAEPVPLARGVQPGRPRRRSTWRRARRKAWVGRWAILGELGNAGYHSVIGVVALPNPVSERLLEALGFRSVGTIREAGFKLDRWWDVAVWQRVLE